MFQSYIMIIPFIEGKFSEANKDNILGGPELSGPDMYSAVISYWRLVKE